MSLRRRLTLALGAILAVGLAVAGVAIYTSVHSYLYGRLDDQLDAAQLQAYRYLTAVAIQGAPPKVRSINNRLSPNVYVLLVGSDGREILRRPSGPVFNPDPQPILPRRYPVQRVPRRPHFLGHSQGPYRSEVQAFGLAAAGSRGIVYQAEAVRAPQGNLVVAVPVASTVATLDSLVQVEAGTSVALVLLASLAAFFIVRRSLRPLEDMTAAAGAIASGELSRRVPADDEASEVGRLGRALNGMLSQIQAAFDKQRASEGRLRQFVADASHELRTPLTSIRGYTELLRKGAFDDEEGRIRALERVESEATRMGVLVDDLLLLARLDQGRPLVRAPVSLATVAAEAVEDARAVAPERPLAFSATGEVVVMGDEQRLRQAVDNLVRNALVHTEAHTAVSVEVTTGPDVGRVVVADEGPGMAPQDAARAFDRFFRADPSRTGTGTGLGLSIVQAVAQALGGRATVVSAKGRGSTFVLEVPLAPEAPSGPDDPGSPRPETGPRARHSREVVGR